MYVSIAVVRDVRGDSMDFKSRGLRGFRGIRGYAIDFYGGGLRGFSGNSGGFGGLTCWHLRYRTVREVGRYIGSYSVYSIDTVIGTVEFIIKKIDFFIWIPKSVSCTQ